MSQDPSFRSVGSPSVFACSLFWLDISILFLTSHPSFFFISLLVYIAILRHFRNIHAKDQTVTIFGNSTSSNQRARWYCLNRHRL
jgi:hypothetical protein